MQNDSILGNPLELKKYEELKFRNNLDELYHLINSNKNAFPNSLPLFEKFYKKNLKDNKEFKNSLNVIKQHLKNIKSENNIPDSDILKINQDIKEIDNKIHQID
tara:strand:- start:479 stop:790 length:312 start_codon:yes stop_codon:yes gene_type:complete